MKEKKSRYKGKKDIMDNIHNGHKLGEIISKGESSTELVKFDSISMPSIFSSLFIELQHYGKVGSNPKPTTHYPPYYYIPKQQYNSLISLFTGLNLKEELHPILFMAFASMCLAAARAPKFEWFLKQTNQQKDELIDLLRLLEELKSNKKVICSVHFKYHDIVDGKRSSEHLPYTIKGVPADFLQSVLSFYEQAPNFSIYKSIADHSSIAKKFDPPQTMKGRNKKIDYYTQGLMLFLLKFHIKGIGISSTESFDDPRLRWPELSDEESKRFKMEDLYLFIGKMLELSGLIEYKPKKEEATLKGLKIDDEHLIERVRKKWANKPESPKFSFGLILPSRQVPK
jgi:hypothetical protein